MLIMKSRKRETIEGIELQTQKSIRRILERENYKYLGICEADTIKQIKKLIGSKYGHVSLTNQLNISHLFTLDLNAKVHSLNVK